MHPRPHLLILPLLLAALPACDDAGGQKIQKAPGEDFHFDDQVRITAPANGATVPPEFVVRWDAGEDVQDLRLEVDGALLRQFTRIEAGPGYFRIDVETGAHDLRLVGVDADGNEVSDHQIVVRVSTGDPWVTLTSPADGDTVPNPAYFAVAASEDVDEVEILADDWSLGTVAPGEILAYRFTGTGFERHIEARAFDDGTLVATHDITLTIDDGTDPGSSSFNDHVMGYVDSYPRDGSYAYWWPSGVDWGGNPHDIYYLGELFSAGDPEYRSF